MTLQGAIKQLHELRCNEDVPVYLKPAIAEVINTLLMDTQEVQHGHWVYEKGDCFPKCSVCGQYHGTLYEHYYCPVCGASMDGDAE